MDKLTAHLCGIIFVVMEKVVGREGKKPEAEEPLALGGHNE